VKLSYRLVVVEVCIIYNNVRLVRSAVLGMQLPIGIKQEASTYEESGCSHLKIRHDTLIGDILSFQETRGIHN